MPIVIAKTVVHSLPKRNGNCPCNESSFFFLWFTAYLKEWKRDTDGYPMLMTLVHSLPKRNGNLLRVSPLYPAAPVHSLPKRNGNAAKGHAQHGDLSFTAYLKGMETVTA